MPEDRKRMHAIEKALAEDERTANLESVHVKAVGGAVFLDGAVETEQQRDAVEEVAKSVAGVKLVRNRLQLDPSGQPGGWREPHHHEEEG